MRGEGVEPLSDRLELPVGVTLVERAFWVWPLGKKAPAKATASESGRYKRHRNDKAGREKSKTRV